MRSFSASAAVVLLAAAVAAAQELQLTAFVNPFIGMGGGGWGISEVPVGPQVPFGAIRLGPDTSLGLEPYRLYWEANGGYNYNATYVECFSHTHVDGAGGQDWQNFGVMVTRQLTKDTIANAGYKSTFTHVGELASPGYYAVQLTTPATFAEVTACGTHTGRHRYTCSPASAAAPNASAQPCFLLLDACHVALRTDAKYDFAKACKSAEILSVEEQGSEWVVNAKVFSAGEMSYPSKFGGEEVYFTMRVAAAYGATGGPSALPNATVSFWENGTITRGAAPPNGTATTSQSLGVALEVPPSPEGLAVVFDVAAAISFVSPASAVRNLHATLGAPGSMLSFDECRAAAVAEWEGVLGLVELGDAATLAATRRDELVVLYTALYHAHLSPTTYTEANGEFMGFDGNVHTLPFAAGNATGPRHVSDLSLWDTFRSHAPLMVLIQPDMARDTVTSMLSMYELSGNRTFPMWPMANVETGLMVAHHGVIHIADAIKRGVRGFDVEAAIDAIVHTIKVQDTEKLGERNFAPIEETRRSAAKTLDYATDAGTLYTLGRWLNRSDIADTFANHSQAYRNLWDAKTQAFCARHLNGTMDCDYMYLPYPIQCEYVEGNGEQYRWYVQHDPYGLVSLYRSRDEYATQLYRFHTDALKWPFNTTLPNPFFWAGNEPTFFTPFQFAYAGNEYAHLTQRLVPVLNDAYFFNGPAGVPGNDDYGAMASWLTFGYLGLYPAATSNNYTLFVPRFDNVTLRVSARGALATPFAGVPAEGGAVLQLVAHGRPAAGTTAYLGNVSVNGVALETPFVTHEQLAAVGAAGGVARIDFYLCGEATVFGAPAPSQGGPLPFEPPAQDEAVVAARMKALAEQATRRISGGKRRRHNFRK